MFKQSRRIRRRLRKHLPKVREYKTKCYNVFGVCVNGFTDILKYAHLDDFHHIFDPRRHFLER